MSRTSVGRDFTSDAMHKAASRPTAAEIMALSESTTAIPTPNTWTSFGGAPGNEMAADGFARGTAAYAHTAGQSTSTLQRTFTHSSGAGSGTPRTPRIAGIYAQASGGAVPGAADSGIPVFFTAILNPAPLTGTDSIAVTETIDFGALT